MNNLTVREVEKLLGISRSVINNLIDAGFVAPTRGKRREYLFSFQDLIVLRTAQGLSTAKIPPRKIARSLQRLRDELPDELPLSGLRITAVGNDIVVKKGASQWRADSGQYLLDFEVTPAEGSVSVLNRPRADDCAQYWFDRGAELEPSDREQALGAYAKAIAKEPAFAAAYVNLGYLLHTMGNLEQAERVYREALVHCPDQALLHFNLGVALEDRRHPEEAAGAYEAALRLDADFADAHYNLARLKELHGQTQDALRHYSEYRRLQS
jgi:tetratricopeptide (TPR) repeat protein